jgi:hypothetical protein
MRRSYSILFAREPCTEKVPVPVASSPLIPGPFRAVRIVLGCVLLAAAAFKAHVLADDPFSQVSLFFSPRLQLAQIELEAVLGLWLLSGLYPRAAWLAACLAFTALAVTSFTVAVLGYPSCGCFGRVSVSPWFLFGVDALAVAALLRWGPSLAPWDLFLPLPSDGSPRSAFGMRFGITVILTALLGALCWVALSPFTALATLRGESLTLDPPVAHVGKGAEEDVQDARLRVVNQTNRPIRLVGMKAGCSGIVTTDNLPLTIPAREACHLAVQVKFAGSAGGFQQPVILYTDDSVQPVVVARIVGHVVARPAP